MIKLILFLGGFLLFVTGIILLFQSAFDFLNQSVHVPFWRTFLPNTLPKLIGGVVLLVASVNIFRQSFSSPSNE
jgi:hypothetical protein